MEMKQATQGRGTTNRRGSKTKGEGQRTGLPQKKDRGRKYNYSSNSEQRLASLHGVTRFARSMRNIKWMVNTNTQPAHLLVKSALSIRLGISGYPPRLRRTDVDPPPARAEGQRQHHIDTWIHFRMVAGSCHATLYKLPALDGKIDTGRCETGVRRRCNGRKYHAGRSLRKTRRRQGEVRQARWQIGKTVQPPKTACVVRLTSTVG